MRLLLTLAISAWFGVALGAIFESAVLVFWGTWLFVGILLTIGTVIYIRKHRLGEENARNF
jgi:hypothetical protein